MAEAKRDENRVVMMMGVSDTDGVTPIPLRVDPATGRLLIDVTVVSSSSSTVPTNLKRDANYRSMVAGVTDDASQTITPLIVDNRNNYLYLDLV